MREGGRGKWCAAFANSFPPEIHVAHKVALRFGTSETNGFLGLQVIQIILQHLLRIRLPIQILEVVVHFRPLLDHLAAGLVVLVVIHEIILRGQQPPEDILILL